MLCVRDIDYTQQFGSSLESGGNLSSVQSTTSESTGFVCCRLADFVPVQHYVTVCCGGLLDLV